MGTFFRDESPLLDAFLVKEGASAMPRLELIQNYPFLAAASIEDILRVLPYTVAEANAALGALYMGGPLEYLSPGNTVVEEVAPVILAEADVTLAEADDLDDLLDEAVVPTPVVAAAAKPVAKPVAKAAAPKQTKRADGKRRYQRDTDPNVIFVKLAGTKGRPSKMYLENGQIPASVPLDAVVKDVNGTVLRGPESNGLVAVAPVAPPVPVVADEVEDETPDTPVDLSADVVGIDDDIVGLSADDIVPVELSVVGPDGESLTMVLGGQIGGVTPSSATGIVMDDDAFDELFEDASDELVTTAP